MAEVREQVCSDPEHGLCRLPVVGSTSCCAAMVVPQGRKAPNDTASPTRRTRMAWRGSARRDSPDGFRGWQSFVERQSSDCPLTAAPLRPLDRRSSGPVRDFVDGQRFRVRPLPRLPMRSWSAGRLQPLVRSWSHWGIALLPHSERACASMTRHVRNLNMDCAISDCGKYIRRAARVRRLPPPQGTKSRLS